MINFIKNFLSEIISRSNDRNIFAIGSSHFSIMRQYYSEIKNLSDADYKVFSQTGEDGIIDYLLYSLNIKVPKFVEIGVGDYRESNTRYIFQKNCSRGLIVDKNKNLEKKVSKIVKLWKGDLTIIETAVTSENILHILNSNDFDNNLDVFSLDVDGIDYWILEVLPEKLSKIVILEYNPVFGTNLEVTINFFEDNLLSVELPISIECKVISTDASLKGQTVSSSYKPAIINNDLKILVPPFIENGDEITVDSRSLEYIKKVK